MGCDIHMFVEYKCGNGLPWQADEHHGPVWESRCKDDEDVSEAEWCDHCQQDGDDQKYCDAGYLDYSQVRATGRDYALFAKLAGVRGPGPDALGLPDDVSEMVAAASDKYGSNGHSHSWISLEDFKQIFKKTGRDYPATKSEDAFYEINYPGGYSSHPPNYTTLINYCDKLKEKKSVDKQILGEDTSSEVQVRLVFWFDN